MKSKSLHSHKVFFRVYFVEVTGKNNNIFQFIAFQTQATEQTGIIQFKIIYTRMYIR